MASRCLERHAACPIDRDHGTERVAGGHRGDPCQPARRRNVQHAGVCAIQPRTFHALGDDELGPWAAPAPQCCKPFDGIRSLDDQVLVACHEQIEPAYLARERLGDLGEGARLDLGPGPQPPEPSLHSGGEERAAIAAATGREEGDERCVDLVGDGREHDHPGRAGRHTRRGASGQPDRIAGRPERQAPSLTRPVVDEADRRSRRLLLHFGDRPQPADASSRGLLIPSRGQDVDAHAKLGGGLGRVQDGASRDELAIDQVDRQTPHHQEVRRGTLLYHLRAMALYFYELHEAEGDLPGDALLVSERPYAPDAFADLVRSARQAVLETFEEDTLVEAVARQLERSHGFTYIGDEKLTASMSVGFEEEDTYLVEGAGDFRSLIVELDRSS